jgi:two-component system sensor kinase FixL
VTTFDHRRLQETRATTAPCSCLMGQLTAAIVHELGQPLTAILTNAHAGLRVIASGNHDGNDVRDCLQDIVADGRRASAVIRHLRSLYQSGHVERRPLLLNDVLNDVVAAVGGDAERRGISVVVDLDPRLPRVPGVGVQLQQVLLNLVINAFEAVAEVTDGPREVMLRTRTLAGERVQVDVADTGPGIAAQKLDAIFEPFVTTKVHGMGVGLSVSRSIIDIHEGQLWAENGPNGGATFHILLPAIAEASGRHRKARKISRRKLATPRAGGD